MDDVAQGKSVLLGRKALALTADLTAAEEAVGVAETVVRELGKIDILVNNVGGYRMNTNNHVHRISLVDTAEDEWRRVLDSNLTTAFLTCKAVLPHMVQRRTGAIIGLASRDVARQGMAGQASYCAAKAACLRLNEALPTK